MSEMWVVNSATKLEGFIGKARHLFESDKYVVFRWKIGPVRTLDQNSLFQMWARQYASHVLRKPTKDVMPEEHECMKATLKRHYYAETAADYMIWQKKDLFTGQAKTELQSTTRLTTGEMFAFMEWVQAKAADDGLVLEAIGEYERLKKAVV